MIQLPVADFIGRVMTGRETVQFSHVDPYGHLNAPRYLELIFNQRILSVEEQLGCSTLEILRDQNLAFVAVDVLMRFLRPSFYAEHLEIGTWVMRLLPKGIELGAIVISAGQRQAKACARIEFRTVDMRTGLAVVLPSTLPSHFERNFLPERPLVESYVADIHGVPFGFFPILDATMPRDQKGEGVDFIAPPDRPLSTSH